MKRSFGLPAPGIVAAVLGASLLAGCLAGDSPADDPDLGADDSCGPRAYTFWFQPDGTLAALAEAPAVQTAVPGNGFAEAFLTDDMWEWLSAPLTQGLLLTGNVTVEYWARNIGTPAPVVLGGSPGEGYHFFNQFGSTASFQPSYAVEYRSAAPPPGTIDHYNQTLEMPVGGFVVEAGEAVRLLLTSLTLDGPDGGGHEIMVGGETPSRVSFMASCFETTGWEFLEQQTHDISLAGNRGLLTGAVPDDEGTNTATVWFELLPGTTRLTVSITQQDDANPVKDDIDLSLVHESGEELWGMGSPYSDETGRLWADNLAAIGGPGRYGARVDSYSGIAYEGQLTIIQDGTA